MASIRKQKKIKRKEEIREAAKEVLKKKKRAEAEAEDKKKKFRADIKTALGFDDIKSKLKIPKIELVSVNPCKEIALGEFNFGTLFTQ